MFALALAGCFSPRPDPGLVCAADHWCPPPETCGADGYCHASSLDASIDTPDAPGPANYAFVTSDMTTLASYADRDALDQHCATLAGMQGKGGTYVAWFSLPGSDAIDRIAGHAGWIRPDGETFITSTAAITAGKILYPLRIDEKLNDRGDELVATATGTDGKYTFGATCFNNGTGNADYGFSQATMNWWTSAGNPSTVGCTKPVRFYCFQIDDRPAAPQPAHTGRHAYLSASGIDGGSTRDMMDAKCQAEAPVGVTMIALVASSGASATSRVGTGAPFVRPDGVVFMTGDTHTITAPLDVTNSLGYEDLSVWAGAMTVSTTPAGAGDDCNNWGDVGGTGRQGSSSQTSDSGFGNGGMTTCTLNNRVYCVEP